MTQSATAACTDGQEDRRNPAGPPGRPGAGGVRSEIAVSWDRSASFGLRPDHVEARYDPDLDFGGQLAVAARPVADQLSQDLAGTGVALMLADARAGLIDRWVTDGLLRLRLDQFQLIPGFLHGEEHVGTNAIGTALSERGPVGIYGREHFADVLRAFACSAAPVTDPRTGATLGAVGLTCAAGQASPLMLPLVRQASREIERRLTAGAPGTESALLESFRQARRRAKGPLLSVSSRALHTNAAAARLLQPADRALIWAWATRALASDPRAAAGGELRLTSGLPVTARVRAVSDGGEVIGALVRFDPPASALPGPLAAVAPTGAPAARPASAGPGRAARLARDAPAFGWDSLTDTERGVAGIIARGATNREAAARLYLSRHTIDYHLRQIFRKLGITSRVELARLVVQQVLPPSPAT